MDDFRKEKESRKMPTTLNTDDLTGRAEKPASNLVDRKNKSLGYIIARRRRGRITYEWRRAEYRGAGLSPRSILLKFIGNHLPPGIRLGRVDEKTAKKLMEGR